MKILFKDLVNLKVETESGVFLGNIKDIVVDISSQSILEYHIKPSSLVKTITRDYLVITRGQVLEISHEKMVTRDLEQKDQNKKIINPKIKKKAINLLSKDI